MPYRKQAVLSVALWMATYYIKFWYDSSRPPKLCFQLWGIFMAKISIETKIKAGIISIVPGEYY